MGEFAQTLGLGGSSEQSAAPIPGSVGDPALVHPMGQDGVGPEMMTGDTWKPKKATTLGTIADLLLGVPIFTQKAKEDNLKSAMEGFDQNPLQAIRRLSQLKGQQGAAWNMYNTYEDNLRADKSSQSLDEARQDKGRDRIAAMLGAIGGSKDPQALYQKTLPSLRKYEQSRGIKESELPDNYDPELLQTYRLGGLNVDDQMDNARDSAYKGARLEQIDKAEEGRNSRFNEGENRQDSRTSFVQDREDQRAANRPRSSATPRGLNKDYIDPSTGQKFPEGKIQYTDKFARKMVNGDWIYFSKDGKGTFRKSTNQAAVAAYLKQKRAIAEAQARGEAKAAEKAVMDDEE